MNVGPVGAAPAVPGETLLRALLRPPFDALQTQDTVSLHLGDILTLLHEDRLARVPPDFDRQLTAAIANVKANPLEAAFAELKRLIALDPDRALPLIRSAPFESRLIAAARTEAGHLLATASRLIEAPEIPAANRSTLDLRTIVNIAEQFFEAGTHRGYLLSAELSQTMVPGYYPQPLSGPLFSGERHAAAPLRADRTRERLLNLWRRAPLLVLLVAWILAGTAILIAAKPGSALAAAWSTGLLSLVVLQFIVTVRNFRRKR